LAAGSRNQYFRCDRKSAPINAEPLYNLPVYNPGSKSYFELYSPDATDPKKRPVPLSGGIDWIRAAKMAQKKSMKGVRGRLATVNTSQIHEFLPKTFDSAGPVWIGLRYWCRYRKLQWITGSIHPRGGFQKWGRIWNETAVAPTDPPKRAGCPNHKTHTLGVHYWSVDQGFFWNSNGRFKQFNALFIEYPTGKK
jgi:hypothetical protein